MVNQYFLDGFVKVAKENNDSESKLHWKTKQLGATALGMAPMLALDKAVISLKKRKSNSSAMIDALKKMKPSPLREKTLSLQTRKLKGLKMKHGLSLAALLASSLIPGRVYSHFEKKD